MTPISTLLSEALGRGVQVWISGTEIKLSCVGTDASYRMVAALLDRKAELVWLLTDTAPERPDTDWRAMYRHWPIGKRVIADQCADYFLAQGMAMADACYAAWLFTRMGWIGVPPLAASHAELDRVGMRVPCAGFSPQ